jgi:predicted MFS family arabinose efflux permease
MSDDTPSPVPPLQNPLFRRFLIARFFGSLGNQFFSCTIAWLVYEKTRSEFASGMIGLVEIIPVFLLALPAGHLADKKDRRSIILVVRAIMAACAILFALLAHFNAAILFFYILLAIVAGIRTFYSPALENLLPRLVPEAQFAHAITYIGSMWQTASLVGPLLCGVLIKWLGAAPVFLLDAVLGGVAVILFRALPKQAPSREATDSDDTPSLSAVFDGGRFLLKSPDLLACITLDLFAVLFGGAVALIPAFNKTILHADEVGYGFLRAAMPFGALVMGFILRKISPFNRNGWVMLGVVAGFGLSTIVFAYSKVFILSFLMLALAGALDGVSVMIRSTLMLVRVPDSMRGRVAAFNDIFVGASNELGGFESGLAARYLGLVRSVALGGVATLVVTALTAWLSKPLRNMGKL